MHDISIYLWQEHKAQRDGGTEDDEEADSGPTGKVIFS